MRTVIFGGSGFIGTHLAKALARRGCEVTVADIAKPSNRCSGVEYVFCDVRSPIAVRREQPFDVVYNLAAIHRTPGHAPYEYYETNVAGAQNIIDWCSDGGERRLVFTSSIAVYGPSEAPKSEAAPPAPNSDYGRSKLVAESIHRLWRNSGPDRSLTIVRPAVVFGAGEHGNFTRLAAALRRGRFLYAGRTDTVKSCGYVADLIRAMLYADSFEEAEVTLNFCYPARYTIRDICDAFSAVAGFRSPRVIPPSFISSVLRLLKLINPKDQGTLSAARVEKLTASTNIVPGVLQSSGFEWATDLRGGIEAWSAASGGRFQ